MDIYEALEREDYEALVAALPHARGMSLLDALTTVDGRTRLDERPDGLWHVAVIRHNTLTIEGGRAEALGEAARRDGAAIRAAMVGLAERGTLAQRVAKRAFSDLGFLVVRPDGAWRAVPGEEPVTFAGEKGAPSSTLPFDLLDRLERAAHPHAASGAWLAPTDVAADAATLSERWPASRDTVLSFVSDALEAEARAALEAALGGSVPHAAVVVRRGPSQLLRTLYAGDFLGPAAPTRVEIVMLTHRRLWSPTARTA